MLYGKVLERDGKVANHSMGVVGHTSVTPEGGERVNMSQRTTSPDVLGFLLQEYRVSWAALSSPLRKLSHTPTLHFRHRTLNELWRK